MARVPMCVAKLAYYALSSKMSLFTLTLLLRYAGRKTLL
jgi:hypothetical protein